MIIRTNRELKRRFDEFTAGDCFIGMLTLKHLRQNVFVDLLERGVRILPSALSQTLSHSKASQARVFEKWMVPHTLVITRRVDLMSAMNTYDALGVHTVVTKEDHLQCGYGIHKWESLEDVYNELSFDPRWYPFVLQPFLKDYIDVRVIVAGDYWEAYSRENPHNFRMNLSLGGTSRPYDLSKDQLTLCNAVMARGRFPYAHVDLLVTADRRSFLSEIALNGGMKGAQIKREKLDALKRDILEAMARS
jgi:glutathione synthase/RimK-type ligase-like ATP-grasp enzyme